MFLSSSKEKPDNEVTQIGALLRQSREARSENLDDIAAELLIDPNIISALEDGRVKDLPGWARAVGALRAYAGYLELDATPLVVRYRKILTEPAGYAATPMRQADSRPEPVAVPEPRIVEPPREGSAPASPASSASVPKRNRTPKGLIFAVTVFIGLAVMAGVYLSSSPAPDTDIQPVSSTLKAMLDRTIGATGNGNIAKEQETTAKVHTETKPLPGLATGGDTAAEKTTTINRTALQPETQGDEAAGIVGNSVNVKPVDRLTQSRNSGTGRLTLRANAPVWVRVANAEGVSVMTREMKAGEMYLVPDEKGLVLEVRDAGAVEYFLDGKLVGKLGKSGETLSGIELDNSIRQKTDG